MPSLRSISENYSPYNADSKTLVLSSSSLSLETNKSIDPAHAPLRIQSRQGTSSMDGADSLLTPEVECGRRMSCPRRHRTVRSLPSPESSPERPSHKRKASAKVTERRAPVYLTPPGSDDEHDALNGTAASGSEQSVDFPLNRRPLPNLHYSKTVVRHNGVQIIRRRGFSTGNRRLTPKPSTDRFISNRASAYDLSLTFRSTKAAQDLTRSEKLLRDSSASPDPFGRLTLPRLRKQSIISPGGRQGTVRANRNRSRTTGAANAIALPQETSALESRQVSAGAVWNVGGIAPSAHIGPVRAISNGRGGYLSSGSNAPMYTAEFLDESTQDQEMETMENRIAKALDIDRTGRLISTVRSLGEPRSASTGPVGLNKRSALEGPKTTWNNGEWVRSCNSRK